MAVTAANAGISSTFAIEVRDIAGGTGSLVVTNPGRAFKISQVLITGANGSTVTVHKNSAAGTQASSGITAVATDNAQAVPSTLNGTLANLDFASTDNIYIGIAGAACTSVIVLCIATSSGQALATGTFA